MKNLSQYQALYSEYRWLVPTRFNVADVCCRRWATSAADTRRIAIYTEDAQGARDIWTFERLFQTANRLSHGLARMGVRPGDRVAVLLGPGGEAAAAHMGIYQLGAVCVPLSPALAPEALEWRLRDCEARVAILGEAAQPSLAAILHRCPALTQLIGVGFADERTLAWRSLLARQEDEFTPVDTLATDPALLLYTGGTTGAPKGVLHAHASLIGALPGFVAAHDWFPHAGDSIWTPADWSWSPGLFGGLLPALYFARPVLAVQGRIGAERAFDVLARYRITNALIAPALLRAMMRVDPPPAPPPLLRSLVTTGEPLDPAVLAWAESRLGVLPNEVYGQSEAHLLIGNSRHKWPVRPGSMGLAFPGHQVAVIDEAGQCLPPGEIGELAVHRRDVEGDDDPALMLGYWRGEAATAARFTQDWWRTGDLARQDDEGYFWYEGRADDVFRVGEHRIGPGSIESWLRRHPAVANAVIVPKPDDSAGAIVKAYVVLTEPYIGQAPSYLLETLQTHARERLAPYEHPGEIEFVDNLPMTSAGTVQRNVLRQRERDRAARRRARP